MHHLVEKRFVEHTLQIERADLLTPLTNDEKKELGRMIVRARVAKLSNPTKAQIRDAINALTLEIQL